MQQPNNKHFYTLPVYGIVAHLVKLLSSFFTFVPSHISSPTSCIFLVSCRVGSGPGTLVSVISDALKGTMINLSYYMSEVLWQTRTPQIQPSFALSRMLHIFNAVFKNKASYFLKSSQVCCHSFQYL